MAAQISTDTTGALKHLDLSRLPGLRRYIHSLRGRERDRAVARLTSLDDPDLRSFGVSEAQPAEFDYRVTDIGGVLPADLAGTLYRNGPGRWEDHTGRPLHHLFDGDGMLSAFTIADGQVRYQNRYVRTDHYTGKSGVRHLGTPAPGGVLANLGRFPPNLANTNVVEHAGHLYALWEGGPPHEIDPDTLETIGVRRFGGELRWMGSYSAHPSICPRTDEMFNFGVEFIPRPHLRIYRTDPRGRLRHFRSVALPYVAMVHDFAITERYLVFVVSPIIPDAIPVALGLRSLGDALQYEPDRGSVFILVPRGGGKVRRIESEAVMVFHLSNAYDDGEDTVIDAIRYGDGRLLKRIARFQSSSLDDAPSVFARYRLTRTGRVIAETLSDTPCEFPRHHGGFEGLPHRYSYFTTRRQLGSFYDSITKLDLVDRIETTYTATGAGNSFCEPVFTPKAEPAGEDDGWLLSVEYCADTHTSRLVILDAAHVQAGPVATADLTHHIPQGFHGSFSARG